MTKVEFALIMNIIDKHTIRRSYNYGAPDTTHIDNVEALKDDLIKYYEEVMKDGNT